MITFAKMSLNETIASVDDTYKHTQFSTLISVFYHKGKRILWIDTTEGCFDSVANIDTKFWTIS